MQREKGTVPIKAAGSSESANQPVSSESGLRRLVTEAGHKVLTSWADDSTAYACSVKSVAVTYGHPAFEAHYNKDTGWLCVTDRAPVKIQ